MSGANAVRGTAERIGAAGLAALLAIGWSGVGCGPTEEALEVRYDLVEMLPFAEVLPASAEPLVGRIDDDGFALAAGAAVDFYLEVPPAARLVVGGHGGSDGSPPIEWSIYEEGGEARRLTLAPERGGDLVAPIAAEPGSLVRLRVELLSPGSDSAPEPLATDRPRTDRAIVRAPRVLGAAPAPSEPLSQAVSSSSTHESPNLVIYLIDTLRPDHLGCYGYGKPTSPAIDRFAEEAVLYEDVVAQSSWTKSAVASLFTGLWPTAHGANRRGDRLADDAVTLAERLRDAGYDTGAFVGNPVAGPDYGFDQGFAHFSLVHKAPAGQLGSEALAWIESTEAPFFAYVHTIEPHMPYRPPERERRAWAPEVELSEGIGTRRAVAAVGGGAVEPTERLIEDTRKLYDGEIAANDRAFGEFVSALDLTGRLDDTIVVLLSDHGEEFYEHGDWTHGKNLHDETVRVPLLVRWPGGARGARVTTPVGQVDLLPTLLTAIGLEVPNDLDGTTLGSRGVEDPLFSLLALSGPRHLGIVAGRFKLTERRIGDRVVRQLYDRVDDPGETRNLAEECPIRAAYLAQELRRWFAENPPAWTEEEVELTPEQADELRALGYL